MATKLTHSLVQKIVSPTVADFKMTSVSSMAVSGTTLFVLKSSGIKQKKNVLYPCCLYKVTKFNTKPTVQLLAVRKKDGTIPKIAQHSNGICYAKKSSESVGYLYIATMNEADKAQIIKVGTNGVIKSEIRYKKNDKYVKMRSLNTMGEDKNGNLKFVVGIKNAKTKYHYDIATLIGNELVYSGITFTVAMNAGYDTANDIYYSKGILYSSFFKHDENNRIQYNQILCTDISKVKNGDALKAKKIYTDDALKNETKYEIEGIIIYKSVIYSAANRESPKAGMKSDGVFKLKKV